MRPSQSELMLSVGGKIICAQLVKLSAENAEEFTLRKDMRLSIPAQRFYLGICSALKRRREGEAETSPNGISCFAQKDNFGIVCFVDAFIEF